MLLPLGNQSSLRLGVLTLDILNLEDVANAEKGLAQPPCAPGAERFSISLTGSRFRGIRENAP